MNREVAITAACCTHPALFRPRDLVSNKFVPYKLNIFLAARCQRTFLCFIDLTNRQRLCERNKFCIFCSRIPVLGRNTLRTYLFRKRRSSPRVSKKEERFLRRNIVRYKRGNARYLFYKKILLHAPWEERYDFLAPPA